MTSPVTALARPRLRGVLHQYAFAVALALGAGLVIGADGGRATFAAAVYALGVCGLFGVSALYHRMPWSDPARRWMRRADHAMIFVFIAATYTPVGLLVLSDPLQTIILIIVWACAAGGVVLQLVWVDAPKRLQAPLYIGMGWVSVAAMPQMIDRLGLLPVGGIALGGLLYTAGAIVYARERPDPVPAVFGFHEVFHLVVVLAALLHYSVMAFSVVPNG